MLATQWWCTCAFQYISSPLSTSDHLKLEFCFNRREIALRSHPFRSAKHLSLAMVTVAALTGSFLVQPVLTQGSYASNNRPASSSVTITVSVNSSNLQATEPGEWDWL